MSDERRLHAFLDQAWAELAGKQRVLRERLGGERHHAYSYDQTTGLLSLVDTQGHPSLAVEAVPIGSYSTEHGTWQWSWANDSVAKPLRDRAAGIRKLAERTQSGVFTTPVVTMPPEMPRKLAAAAVQWYQCAGYCRIPVGRLEMYLALFDPAPETL